MASLTVCVFRGNTSICCTSCSNSTEARRAVYRELRQVQVHSDGLWHKGDWNRSFSLAAFTSCILKGANSQLSPHTCNKPAEPIVAQKWSQQLPSKRNRYLSREYLLTLVTSKKLKDTSQVTQNYTNFSPGHKVPSNYGSKKKKSLLRQLLKVCTEGFIPLKQTKFATILKMAPSWWECYWNKGQQFPSWLTPLLADRSKATRVI